MPSAAVTLLSHRPDALFAEGVSPPASALPPVRVTGVLDTAPDLSCEQQNRFVEEDRVLTLRNARLGTWTVVALMPLCSLLDYAAYPNQFWLFFILRVLSSVCALPMLWLIEQPWGYRNYRFFPVFLPVLPALFISLMIYFSGEAHSSYYAGLTLCIVGTSFVFHWTFREIGITLSVVLALYFGATLPHLSSIPSAHAGGIYVNNTIFLLLNCAILYVSSRQHFAIRLREFLGRCVVEDQREELSAGNRELRETLQRLRETEAQLDHSDRLASIGRLSAGIIHEINNPLNFVKSALYVLGKKARNMPEEDAVVVRKIAKDLEEGVNRVAAIVSDLRTFAHPEQQALQTVRVSEVLATAGRFLAGGVQDGCVRLSVEEEPGLLVLGDDRQVLQVLINLVQNSLDALQGLPDPEIRLRAWKHEEGVSIRIRDNGHGIKAEHAAHLFDPFFTTKDVGKGMGLGLCICYRMMQGMHGDIEVESVVGEYTQFTLTFRTPGDGDRDTTPISLPS